MRILLDLQGCQAVGSRNRGIGRYSLALAKELTRHDADHEFWILLNAAFPDSAEWLRQEFKALVAQGRCVEFHPPADCAEIANPDLWRTRAAELIRRHAIREIQPHIVHVSSLFEGLGDSCATSIDPSDGVPCAVTVYDLIPLLNPQRYLRDEPTRSWYGRKIESLRNAELLLCISESANVEATTAPALAGRRAAAVTISSAADPGLFHPGDPGDAAQRLGLKRGFVMYTGGIDWRKNIEGLIRAYALLPAEVRREHQLALVCHAEAYAQTQLLAAASNLGLGPDEVVFTGYVSDVDLASLYRSCALFVFPSLHEGFGLPALEAMMCAAVVIGSDCTSIPEVIGRRDALFDPRSPRSIADLMLRALGDEAFRDSLRRHASEQAAKFSWEITGRRALHALEQLHAGHSRPGRPPAPSRPRLAIHSPLPPAQSGIADYTMELLEVLRTHYDIELVCDQREVALPGDLSQLPVRTVAWFRDHADHYDRVVYQFGNSMFHAYMFGLLREFPGVVVLHDFYLSDVLNWMDTLGHEPGAFGAALFSSHGPEAVKDEQQNGREAAVSRYPCNRAVVQRATGVIVHSRYAGEAAQRWYGPGYARDWRLIPHLRCLPRARERDSARAELGLAPDDILVCSFGHVSSTKLNHRAVAAWNASSLAKDTRCHFVLVGDARPPYGDQVRRVMKDGPIAGQVSITGYADRVLYERYLLAADFAVQLRSGSRGETSGAVLDCLASGVPLIANANGTNAEYPPDVVHLLPDDFSGEQLIGAIEQFRADPAARERLREAGRSWVKTRHDPVAVALQYRDAIEEFSASPCNASYWQTVDAIAGLRDRPALHELVEAAVALAATAAAHACSASRTVTPSFPP